MPSLRGREEVEGSIVDIEKRTRQKTERKRKHQEMDGAHREKQCINILSTWSCEEWVWKSRLSPSPCPWEIAKHPTPSARTRLSTSRTLSLTTSPFLPVERRGRRETSTRVLSHRSLSPPMCIATARFTTGKLNYALTRHFCATVCKTTRVKRFFY